MEYPLDRPWRDVPESVIDQLDVDQLTAYTMGAYATSAVDFAREHYYVRLDYKLSSIGTLEQILSRIYDSIPHSFFQKLWRHAWSEDRIFNESKPWGAYLGEVLRLNHGARWKSSYGSIDPGPGFFMELEGLDFAPVNKVFKRLADGPQDDVHFYYKALLEILEKRKSEGS